MAEPLLVVRRSGGREPSDDESLEVGSDGDFRMWRTVGWRRAGAFAGAVAPDVMEAIRRLAASVPEGQAEASLPRGAAAEEHITSRSHLTLGGSSDPPDEWAELVNLGRGLLDDLVVHPEAALDLSVANLHEASLTVVGSHRLAIAGSSLRWRVERLGSDGLPVDGWRPDGVESDPPPQYVMTDELEAHDPGVFRTLVLAHGWTPAADEILRVWATVAIAALDQSGTPVGLAKTARLVAVLEPPTT